MLIGVDVIEGAYLEDLLQQPAALGRTLNSVGEDARLSRLAEALRAGIFQRVILTGMGSSFHALYPLHLTLSAHGVISQMVETSELVHYMTDVLGPRALLIAVSQSGQSAEMVRLLDLVVGKAAMIGVTNDASSPLACKADVTLLMQAGSESTVSCKTYVATLLLLEWMGAVLCGEDQDAVKVQLQVAAPAAAAYLEGWRDHVNECLLALNGVRQIFVTGRGSSLAAAATSGLILKESARFSAEGMSSAAFRHGPFEILGPEVFVLVLAGDERSAPLNVRLVEDVIAAGGRAVLVSSESERNAFRLPVVPAAVRPILEILPVQMMSLALAAIQGHEAGRFELASKVTTVE